MAMGGMTVGYRPPRATAPTPQFTPEAALPRAIQQQAGDYDDIMGRYRNQLNSNPEYGNLMSRYNQLLGAQQGGPAQGQYAETPEFNEAFSNMRGLAANGGIDNSDEQNLRARGVSPIRAAYQNAQRNMQRQARLSGGSANFNAASSRMAREQGESMAGAMTNVNAGIAEMRQSGRLTAGQALGNLGNSASGRRNEMEANNANLRARHGENTTNILNSMSSTMNSDAARRAQLLGGMTSLYGTTPALVNTFGNQVAQNRQQNQQSAQFAASNNMTASRPGQTSTMPRLRLG